MDIFTQMTVHNRAACELDCATQKHSSLDEEKEEHEDQTYDGQMKIATSVYNLYEVHGIPTLEKGDGVRRKSFWRLRLVSASLSSFKLVDVEG